HEGRINQLLWAGFSNNKIYWV
ncbi:unnamed protein product, partial [Allacma fusca]